MSLARKRPVEAAVVSILSHKRDDRGMQLMKCETRCIKQGEIHELVTTDHFDSKPGDRIDRVGFLGFAETTRGGVIAKGDLVFLGESRKCIGTVLGFDDCHAPNHLNILIARPQPVTGADLQLAREMSIRFE